MAQRKPRNHQIDPLKVEQAARRLGRRVLELMLDGLSDKELCDAYDELRDALVGIPDYSYTPPKKKTPTPKGGGVSDSD
jgi:hypothetical protein